MPTFSWLDAAECVHYVFLNGHLICLSSVYLFEGLIQLVYNGPMSQTISLAFAKVLSLSSMLGLVCSLWKPRDCIVSLFVCQQWMKFNLLHFCNLRIMMHNSERGTSDHAWETARNRCSTTISDFPVLTEPALCEQYKAFVCFVERTIRWCEYQQSLCSSALSGSSCTREG